MKQETTAALANELLALAEGIAQRAGELLSNRPENFDINQKSSARDFATHMDHASEKLIVEALLAARPDDGIIGEEGANRESSSGITWVIDPIDGTVNYFYNLPGWNISIAAKDGDGVLVGIVYAPTLNSLWHATRGGGAFLNGRQIHVSQEDSLQDSLIATGFSYDPAERVRQGEKIASLIPRVRDIRRNGAAAVDLCHVASGAVDGYFESGLKEWDLAAGGLIAREAGALVSGRGGNPAGEAMVIAAGPALHALLTREIG
jgi:myo-inositol-1(or 4)-monophosphatase